MKKMLEHCFICGDPTGRAGVGDDSLYNDARDGPYCQDCWDDFIIRKANVWGELATKTGDE